MPRTVDVVNFRIQKGKAGSMLAGRPGAVAALRASAPGLHSATLVDLGRDEWLDIIVEERLQCRAFLIVTSRMR